MIQTVGSGIIIICDGYSLMYFGFFTVSGKSIALKADTGFFHVAGGLSWICERNKRTGHMGRLRYSCLSIGVRSDNQD